MWRRFRRLVGYWIAGAEPAQVHCSHCGHVISAWCSKHRDAMREATR